ncbi:CYTH domain-containing protein [Falsiroseomonas selenitidurans]|uniref:CYTH domain-containing protein n=1 Tax=Falsiroseomonas selenitidurans TaxID=2716335 RepID=A0ABX1E2K6_9PROT|nr:CYTH domain-containing protein [Falsiroseomonas selenitidurans]NKC29997.1 CYTH domain-containing protein [Falsiroseomonas selenitidurans]
MGVEIERKFLVDGDGWRASARGAGVAMRQGYLSTGRSPVVRVRIAGERAFLTIKGPGGLVRAEFEYAIPVADAEAMLALCPAPPLAKTRHDVPHAGHLWTVDVFEAPARLAGLVLAEVELSDAAETPDLPPWLGLEVTEDPRYANAALAIAGP